ncbi:MAG: hypothetical protein L3J74_04005 [Bacteroidales bacterium]|nr:hypothetical protein [Bacteroidales bacterium]
MKRRRTLGNITFILLLILTSVWAFWGIIENFHEGWYYPTLWKNIGLMFLQYLSPCIILMSFTLISIKNHKVGALIFLLFGIIISFLVNRFNYFVILPFFIVAVLLWFSEFNNQKLKYRLIIFIPMGILLIFSVEPIYRVSHRLNDYDFSARIIKSNGVDLIWAPRGPAWPDDGLSWYEADSICKYLSEDGLTIAATPQNIWRLPTLEEAVRSMHRHGKNCMGKLNKQAQPVYKIEPDKETPLWNPNTKVIYWWTSTELDSNHAYIIVYNGNVWVRDKKNSPNYLGFRAVKELDK